MAMTLSSTSKHPPPETIRHTLRWRPLLVSGMPMRAARSTTVAVCRRTALAFPAVGFTVARHPLAALLYVKGRPSSASIGADGFSSRMSATTARL